MICRQTRGMRWMGVSADRRYANFHQGSLNFYYICMYILFLFRICLVLCFLIATTALHTLAHAQYFTDADYGSQNRRKKTRNERRRLPKKNLFKQLFNTLCGPIFLVNKFSASSPLIHLIKCQINYKTLRPNDENKARSFPLSLTLSENGWMDLL